MINLREYALCLDQQDPLHSFRKQFYIKENVIYLDGNSLGLCSIRAEKSLIHLLEMWKEYGIGGWTEGNYPWFTLAELLGGKMASLIGASASEVIVTGSTTINIHQVISTFFHPQDQRTKIIADELNFPSDIYALKSQLNLIGLDPDKHLIRIKSKDGKCLEEDEIIRMMDDDVAIVFLPTVLYRSGQLLDIRRLTKVAHQRGILIGFDACHSIGVVPHSFHEWEVDFAIWCTYKYLNSGPGGVAGLYVHEKHHHLLPGLTGWFSSHKAHQFDMRHDLYPASYAGAYQIGTPHILSMAPLIGSLEIFEEASIEIIRQKSLKLTRYLMELVETELAGMGFSIGNPLEDERRGGHVCLEHQEAIRICKALKKEDVIPDYREPNVIRLAPISLYTSYVEVWEAVRRLKDIMINKTYEQFDFERGVVA